QPAVDRQSSIALRDEVLVAVRLHVLGNPRQRFVPADPLPLLGAGLAHLGVPQAALAVDEVEQARPFRAKRPAVYRVVGIALYVDDLGLGVLGLVAQAVHDDAASDSAIRAGIARLGGARELEIAHFR